MKKSIIIISLFFFTTLSYAQKEIYNYEEYFIRIDNSTLKAFKSDSTLFYQKKFSNPMTFEVDLDNDDVNEIGVIDNQVLSGEKKYTLFVFNTLDSLYLADSVYSGSTKPYQTFSNDLNTILLVTGNAAFDSLNTVDSLSYLPLNFWKFEDGALYLADASVYEPYIAENNKIIDLIEKYYLQNGKTCEATRRLKGAFASGFVNYYNAGETILASQFLKNYYLCSDIDNYKRFLLKSFK